MLWRGDTVTATSLDTVLQEEMVEVPVQLVATPGTGVLLRLRTEASAGLQYEVESGFHFGQSFDTASAMPKRKWYREEDAESEIGAEEIAAEVIPNPTTAGKVEIRLRVNEGGTVGLGLYTMLGQQIATLPSVEVTGAGVTTHELNLNGIAPGNYLLVIEQGNQKASAKVTVVGE
ncbi:MAG: T9SS type A sorting domain-containing protein [Armatimonadetes bacterium]|nr:T9SS type A sorting domain-containing protein [Armatimonadota bacterium]